MNRQQPFKVLLVYPGLFMQTALPLGIASLVAGLKENGIEARVFDTVLYQLEHEVDENEERAEVHHSTKRLDYRSVGISRRDSDMVEDFRETVASYAPDLIALSAVESTFERGITLTRAAKKISKATVIAGGVFPTLAPEVALQEPSVDLLCIGEGEELIVELSLALASGSGYHHLPNLAYRGEGGIVKNPIAPLKPLGSGAAPDFSAFAPYMFYKPMQGNLFKTIPVEISRGCPYECTYCAEPALKRLHKGEQQSYFRKKPIGLLLAEIDQIVERHAPRFLYFATETFLAMSEQEFDRFVAGYARFKIPFWVQTRPETVTLERIRRMQEVGLFWITMGIECGNEEYRRTHLKRSMKNETIVKAIEILSACGQGASLNSIIGFPHESRELMFETIELNRELFRLNDRIRVNISTFTPFRGCELYQVSVQDGLMTERPFLSGTNISDSSVLSFDAMSQEEFAGITRTLPLYVYLPDEYQHEIRLCESFSEEGNLRYAQLNRLVAQYLQ